MFDYHKALQHADTPVFFVGEMIYLWMVEDYACLKPLAAVAEKLAEYPKWEALYDPAALRQCEAMCVAMIHVDDMYVEAEFSEATARLLPKMKVSWLRVRETYETRLEIKYR